MKLEITSLYESEVLGSSPSKGTSFIPPERRYTLTGCGDRIPVLGEEIGPNPMDGASLVRMVILL